MYTKLYPVSERNRNIISAYADKLFEMSEAEEQKGNFSKAEEHFSRACEVGAILHEMDITSDGKVAWLKGAQVAMVKKIVAIA